MPEVRAFLKAKPCAERARARFQASNLSADRYIFQTFCIKYEKSMKNILQNHYSIYGAVCGAYRSIPDAAAERSGERTYVCQNVKEKSRRYGCRL